MALDGSIDGLAKLENNGISMYVDANLRAHLEQLGGLLVDYVNRSFGGGYIVRAGGPDSESGCGGSCSSC